MPDKDTEITLTPMAMQNIGNMEHRLAQIRDEFGRTSDEYLDALESLQRSMSQVFRLGGKVWAEDSLALLGQSFITYGVIFHRTYREGTPQELAGTWSVHS